VEARARKELRAWLLETLAKVLFGWPFSRSTDFFRHF
jgi:hypothetical protein